MRFRSVWWAGILLIVFFGCAPRLKLQVKAPGELNIQGVSKIAVLGFNTIKGDPGAGQYAADKSVQELARRSLMDVLYDPPFYSLVDLDLEGWLDRDDRIKRSSRFDGLIYGKLWWQVSPEYRNVKPAVHELRKWHMVKYVCGYDRKKNPQYCKSEVTTQTQEEYHPYRYRAVKASLMLSLSLYQLNADSMDGKLKKLTQVTEISCQEAVIENGDIRLTGPLLLGAKKGEGDGSGGSQKGFSDFLNAFLKDDKNKAADEIKKTANIQTIPTDIEFAAGSSGTIQRLFQRSAAPHFVDFEVEMPMLADSTTAMLLQTNAYRAAVRHIIFSRLSSGYPEYCDMFYDGNFSEAAQKVTAKLHEDEFKKESLKAPPDKKPVYATLSPEELKNKTEKYLKDHTTDIYLLGLAVEALGDFERALEVYRFGFYKLAPTDQGFADGIGRCLSAMNMANTLSEQVKKMREARKESNL